MARSYSSDELEEVEPVNRGVSVQQLPPREGPRLWSVFLLSALASAAAVAAVGGVCALVYPILKGVGQHWFTLNQMSTTNFIGTVFDHQGSISIRLVCLTELRVEKVIGHDGTEERMLGKYRYLLIPHVVCSVSRTDENVIKSSHSH